MGRRGISRRLVLLIGWLLCILPSLGLAKEIVNLTLMFSSGDQRGVFNRQVRLFERENPGIEVVVREMEQEYYKGNVAKWLEASTSQSDVLYWFGGAKLRWFAAKGWVEPLDDLWKREHFDDVFTPSAKSAVVAGDKVYGLPIAYYQWGFYYRKSIFKQYKLQPPQTWDEFIALGERLKANGITPVALGSADRWPVAGWFDYLDLRLNGLAFHQKLMAGKTPYTDPRVREVFRYWKDLIDRQFFLASHSRHDWRGALPYLYRGRAGMVLMGNFLVPQLPESIRDDIGFFRFPRIKAEMPYFEDAPIDALIIPRNAANKDAARKLLTFFARADVQTSINAAMGMISPNRAATLADDRFIRAGAEMLGAAEGIAQFYDRDTPREMFEPGMDIFVQFMLQPDSIDQQLGRLEAVRQRVFR